LPPPATQAKLQLTGHKVYKTGIVSLEYSVNKSAPAETPKRSAASKSGSARASRSARPTRAARRRAG
jgi:hypothetical protein